MQCKALCWVEEEVGEGKEKPARSSFSEEENEPFIVNGCTVLLQ
jgi:hypothetical protein